MQVNSKVDFYFDRMTAMEKLGVNPGGRVQQIVDASTIKWLRQLMPRDSGIMATNTRQVKPGDVWVMTPYAHYMNKGELYVMENGKGAYYSPTYGFWSKKGVKKSPSGRPLTYHGGANRGANFVERTLNEHLDDILNDARKGLKK